MVRKTFFWQYIIGFVAGLCVFYFICASESTSDANVSIIRENKINRPNVSSSGPFSRHGRISTPNDKNSQAQAFSELLDNYSRLNSQEIRGVLEEINGKIMKEEYSQDAEYVRSLISLYYLAHRWSRMSPVEAMNFKEKTGIDGRLSDFTDYPRVYYDRWNIIIEAGEQDGKE